MLLYKQNGIVITKKYSIIMTLNWFEKPLFQTVLKFLLCKSNLTDLYYKITY